MNPLVIEDGGFRLEQTEVGSPFWDLYAKRKTKHKDGTESADWKIFHYGVSIENALNSIIMIRMAARHSEVLSLKEFFKEYQSERISVIEAFHLQTVNLTKDLIKLQKNVEGRND